MYRLAATLLGWVLIAGTVQAGSLIAGAGVIDEFESNGAVMGQLAFEQNPMPKLGGMSIYSGLLVAEEDTLYVHGGLAKSFELPGRWSWGGGLSVGLYHSNHPQLDLGHDLEFMSRLFLEYEVAAAHSLRFEAGHLSNANLGGQNPGTEFIMLNWIFRY